jgi:hypothetical protein
MRTFELTGPADEGFVATARLVGASISAQAGLHVDACDDLCLGVETACAVMLSADTTGLAARFVVDDSVEVTIRTTTPQPLRLGATGRLVLAAVIDDVALDPAVSVIRLVKHRR